jgi:glutamate-1-semialdehyde 2,1-aminomutase
MFFTSQEVYDYQTAKTSDTQKYARYFRSMLEQGISLAPSQFEATFISTAHSNEDIERTVEASKKAAEALRL